MVPDKSHGSAVDGHSSLPSVGFGGGGPRLASESASGTAASLRPARGTVLRRRRRRLPPDVRGRVPPADVVAASRLSAGQSAGHRRLVRRRPRRLPRQPRPHRLAQPPAGPALSPARLAPGRFVGPHPPHAAPPLDQFQGPRSRLFALHQGGVRSLAALAPAAGAALPHAPGRRRLLWDRLLLQISAIPARNLPSAPSSCLPRRPPAGGRLFRFAGRRRRPARGRGAGPGSAARRPRRGGRPNSVGIVGLVYGICDI